MPRKNTGRRRGGQPGNHNRLRHGLYARQLPAGLLGPLNAAGLDRSELSIAVARARLKLCLDKQAADPVHWLSYERAVQYYLKQLAVLVHRNGRLIRQTGISSATIRELLDVLDL